MTGDVQMIQERESRFQWKGFPWWLVAILGFLGLMLLLILTNEDYRRAFNFIRGGFGGVAGIESVPPGQMEAARSLGLNGRQAMRHVILPQAIRNVLPALGNDFIAMLKDSSLISVLAVRDLTQQARLYAGSTFRFRESYLVLTFLYLTMTIALSLILRWYERRLRQNAR